MSNLTPTPGRIVHYQTDGRGGKDYFLPAVITCTSASHPDQSRGVVDEDNPVPHLESTDHLHLHVMTPGPQGFYTEHNVPFDTDGGSRTWRFPSLVPTAK